MVIFNSYVKLPEGRFCEILGVMHELDRKKDVTSQRYLQYLTVVYHKSAITPVME